jgi:hypothetical protein
MYEIQSDIPPPAAPKGPAVYGFERLQPGDSFLVPSTMEMLSATSNRVRWAVKKYRRTHAIASKWRTAVNTKGVRVWRVA